jgi:hypothetical protein
MSGKTVVRVLCSSETGYAILPTSPLYLTPANISKVNSHGQSFYGPRNPNTIHHSNFLSSTPRPDDVVAAADAAVISNMTLFRAPRRPRRPLLRYLCRHLCLLAAQVVRILLLVNVDWWPMP